MHAVDRSLDNMQRFKLGHLAGVQHPLYERPLSVETRLSITDEHCLADESTFATANQKFYRLLTADTYALRSICINRLF